MMLDLIYSFNVNILLVNPDYTSEVGRSKVAVIMTIINTCSHFARKENTGAIVTCLQVWCTGHTELEELIYM